MFYVAILLACSGPGIDSCFIAASPSMFGSLEHCLGSVDAAIEELSSKGVQARGGCSLVSAGEPV